MHRPQTALLLHVCLVSAVLLCGCGQLLLIQNPCHGNPLRVERPVAICQEFSFSFSKTAQALRSPRELRELESQSNLVNLINLYSKEALCGLGDPNAVNFRLYESSLRKMDSATAKLCDMVGGCGRSTHPSYPSIANCGTAYAKDCGGVQTVNNIAFDVQYVLADGVSNAAAYRRQLREMRGIIVDLCKRRHCSSVN